MRTPAFTEEIPTDCACAFCTGAAVESAERHGGTRARCTVRGALAAAVGAAALVGAGAGTASAEPAPSHAGWDGSKYWYKDATGWWRWTSHYDKYQRHTGGSASSGSSGSSSSSSSAGFTGTWGWDGAKYWYKDGSGNWRWTSHQWKYERYAGGSTGSTGSNGGSSSSSSSSGSSNSSSGHNTNPTFRGRAGWDATDRVYWYQAGGSWWWTSHKDRYEARTGKSGSTGGSSSTGSASGSGSGSGSGGGRGTPSRHGTESAIQWAMGQLGKPYSWGGNGPSSYDCSGLVQQAYRRAGISLPRVADAQYRAATPISRSQLRRGDLVFWSNSGSSYGIHHVAIYLGGGQYLEAPRPGKTVRVSSFSYYNPTMYGRVG